MVAAAFDRCFSQTAAPATFAARFDSRRDPVLKLRDDFRKRTVGQEVDVPLVREIEKDLRPTLDTAHEFLQLGLPTEVDAKLQGHSPFIFPQASTLAFKFPARGLLPPVELTWYDGAKNIPKLPTNFGESVVDPSNPPPSSESLDTKKRPPGKVIYGEDFIFKGGSHGAQLQVLASNKAKDLKLPEVPRSPSNHSANFLKACRGEEKCRSNFAVAGPLCQAMALGIIAQRVNAKIKFDPTTKTITNHKAANELLAGVPARQKWEHYYAL